MRLPTFYELFLSRTGVYIYSTFANKFNIIFSIPISTSPKEAYNEKKEKNIKMKLK